MGVFDYSIGEAISGWRIGGRVVAGAGNLETTSSVDVYRSSPGEARSVVFDGEGRYRVGSAAVVTNRVTGESIW